MNSNAPRPSERRSYALAIIAGLIVNMLLVFGIELATHALFPPPPGLDFNDAAALQAYVQTLPSTAFIMVLTGWFIGAFDGALVTAYMVPDHPRRYALIVCSVCFLFAASDFVLLPVHPLWMMLSTPVIYMLAAALAAWLGQRLRFVRRR